MQQLAEDLDRLLVGRGAHHGAGRLDGGGAADRDETAGLDHTAVPEQRLEWGWWIAREPPDVWALVHYAPPFSDGSGGDW